MPDASWVLAFSSNLQVLLLYFGPSRLWPISWEPFFHIIFSTFLSVFMTHCAKSHTLLLALQRFRPPWHMARASYLCNSVTKFWSGLNFPCSCSTFWAIHRRFFRLSIHWHSLHFAPFFFYKLLLSFISSILSFCSPSLLPLHWLSFSFSLYMPSFRSSGLEDAVSVGSDLSCQLDRRHPPVIRLCNTSSATAIV